MSVYVTLLWTGVAETDVPMIVEAAGARGGEAGRVAARMLATAIVAALAKGAVVVVVRNHVEATAALAVGADEVVRTESLSATSLQRAIDRAFARAETRVARNVLTDNHPDVQRALSLLSASIGHDLRGPLTVALLNCESLAGELDSVLRVPRDFISLGSAPSEVAVKAHELHCVLQDLRDSLTRAAGVTRRLCDLATPQHDRDGVDVVLLVSELSELVRGEVERTTPFAVRMGTLRRALVPRALLVCMLGALIAHALESVRDTPRPDSFLEIVGTDEEDAVLIEIRHNGRAIAPDLRPNVLDRYFDILKTSAAGPSDLAGVRQRARDVGGELLIGFEYDQTAFRLVLPAASVNSPVGLEVAGSAKGTVIKTRNALN